jgi:hypothetical protein
VGGDYYDVLHERHGQDRQPAMSPIMAGERGGHADGADRRAHPAHQRRGDPAFLDVLNRTVYGSVGMQTDRNLTLSLIDYSHGRCS